MPTGDLKPAAGSSYGHDNSFKSFFRNREAIFFQSSDLTVHCFSNVGEGFGLDLSLSHGASRDGALHDAITAFAGMVEDYLSHGSSVDRFQASLTLNVYRKCYIRARTG